MVDADEKRVGVACVLGDLLETIAEALELDSISDVALKENNGTNSVIADERCDVVVDDVAVEADSEELRFVSVVLIDKFLGWGYLAKLLALLWCRHLELNEKRRACRRSTGGWVDVREVGCRYGGVEGKTCGDKLTGC